MKKRSLFNLFGITLAFSLVSIDVEAQVIPDNTLGDESSVIIPVDSQTDVLGGGAIRGTNLFHSFQEFSIPEGRGVYFANPEVIQTIFSRVTGNNPSRLFGTLGVLGNANLFFINPNGIIFGPNAKLNISGSFVGSTANSIIFPDGNRFSATNPSAAPLLTIDVPVPLGLEFEGEGGGILNSGNLETGENLALVGGTIVSTGSITAPKDVSLLTVTEGVITNVQFDRAGTYLGQITQPLIEPSSSLESQLVQLVLEGGNTTGLTVTPQGQVSVVGKDTVVETGDIVISGSSGRVSLQAKTAQGMGGNLLIDAFGDVNISNSIINVRASDRGSITINANNLKIDGEGTRFRAGIDDRLGTPTSQAGDISINVTDKMFVSGSVISNVVGNNAQGNAGDIKIHSSFVILADGAVIGASTLGKGNAGAIQITASDGISLAGENSQGLGSRVVSTVEAKANGNSGGIVINTSSLSLSDGAAINANTFGKGNAGAIEITAPDGISLAAASSQGAATGVFSQVAPAVEGNSGGIVIETSFLSLSNGAEINANTYGKGNAGAIQITASDGIFLDGKNNQRLDTGIFSAVLDTAEGSSGGIFINTNSLLLSDGAVINASTFGKGNAGAIEITASDGISLAGDNSQGLDLGTGVFSQVLDTAEGSSGGIAINTSSLSLTNALIDASTFGKGNAGAIEITASDGISLAGEDSQGFTSGVFSLVNSPGEGNSGGIVIETSTLFLTDRAVIDASTFGKGNAGAIEITASDGISFAGENSRFISGVVSTVEAKAEGNSGGIIIETTFLSLSDGKVISANTFGKGNAGTIKITASDGISLAGEDIEGFVSGVFSKVEDTAEGNAGSIILNAPQLTLLEGTVITASTNGKGDGGDIIINSPNSILLSKDSTLSVETTGAGKPGGIDITTDTLTIGENAQLSATVAATSTNTEGGGSITLNANNLYISGKLGIFAETQSIAPAGNLILKPYNTPNLNIRFTDNGFISASTSADGQGGNITISVPQNLGIRGEGKIAVETSGKGNAGDINIITQNLTLTDGLEISASTTGEGNAGNLILKTRQLFIQDGARISSGAVGTGIGGDILIMTDNLTLNRGTISAQTASTTGGNITLDIQNLLTLENNSQISTTAGTAQAGGDGGNITINSPFIVTSPFENSDITANAFLGNGGNITITTLGILGLEVRDTSTPFSDITASSAFGLNGNININNLGIDPTRGIESLPQEVVNPQLMRGCQARNGQEISEFYTLGRGGIPSSPDDWLNEVPFGNEGLIPLETLLNTTPLPINWKVIPFDGVSLSCQSSSMKAP